MSTGSASSWMFVWSAHSRCLFPCFLSIHPLLNQDLLHSHEYPILLIIGLNQNCLLVLAPTPVAGFPGNWWANLMSILPVNHSLLFFQVTRLFLQSACSLPNIISPGFLLLTRKNPYPKSLWCLCHCFWVLSLVLLLGNYKPAELRGAAQQCYFTFVESLLCKMIWNLDPACYGLLSHFSKEFLRPIYETRT